MSNTANLSPKNPLVLVALAAGAFYFLTRRTPAYAGAVQPAPVGGAVNGTNGITNLFTAAGNLFSSLSGAAAPSGPPNPVYRGDWAIGGTWAGWDQWAQQVRDDSTAWQQYVGTADDATGDPYNPGW